MFFFFFFQAEDGIRDYKVTGVQTCALPICDGTLTWVRSMRPLLPLGVKRRISVESPSTFLNAVERQACTISFPGTVCRTLPESAPPKARNFAPGRAPTTTLPLVIAACCRGLRYMA